jgi:RNA polymerase sigma-70 factor (sigma-E family)
LKATDEAEFREYMTARWPAQLRTAYLLSGNRHTAEDLAQTALEKTAAAWARVRSVEDTDAYVRRILVNTHLSRFRAKRVVEVLQWQDTESSSTDSSQQIAQRDELWRALASLPKRQRAVVVLRYWEDLSEAQTAELMGCSVGTVRSQAHKALSKLRVSPLLSESNPYPIRREEERRA